jgi:hypothetical protein
MPDKPEPGFPTVDFCGLQVTRLIIGANPFGGYSHQSGARDEAMRSYYTPDRILETWERAASAGINTMVTNNETPHVLEAVRRYLGGGGGRLQWIAQLSNSGSRRMEEAVDQAVGLGARAVFFHGGIVDGLYARRDAQTLRAWVSHARACGVPAAVAAHAPAAHDWVDSLDLVDFHVVCWFNCGSLHDGQGHMFRLADVAAATACVQRLRKPCIAYKIMGSGRIQATMAFEYAFAAIKAGDVVNVGMHRGDHDGMVEENAAIVRQVLGCETETSRAVLAASQWK